MKKIIDIMMLFILCSIFIISCAINNSNQPIAKKGILNLSNWDFSINGNCELIGEWEFYYNQLLTSSDFSATTKPIKNGYIDLPGLWQNRIMNNTKLPREGYATYRLKVIIDTYKYKNYAIKFEEHTNPLIMFINGKKITEIGTVGINKDSSKYQSYPHIKSIIADSDTLEIIIQMSNFHHRKLAGTKIITIGQEYKILQQKYLSLIFNSVTSGFIVLIALYQILLYYYNKKNDRSYLYFAQFCLFMVFRSLLVGNNAYIHDIIGEINWKIKYMLISICLLGVIYSLFLVNS